MDYTYKFNRKRLMIVNKTEKFLFIKLTRSYILRNSFSTDHKTIIANVDRTSRNLSTQLECNKSRDDPDCTIADVSLGTPALWQ